MRETERRFGPGSHNDAGDAFRHCYWSCCMAQKIGSEAAEDWGTGHEQNVNNPVCEMRINLANNAAGRGSGPNGPPMSCGDHCMLTPLVTSPPGNCCPRGPYYQPPEVPPPVSRPDIGGGV